MSLSKQLYIIIAFIFFIIFSGNFLISVNNMKGYLEVESSTKAQDTATSIGMSLRPLIKDKEDAEIESIIKAISNSGFYKEIRLEDADFIIKSNELIKASTDLDDEDWKITKISVDPKYGYVEKVESDKQLNEQLLKLEDEEDEIDVSDPFDNDEKYRYVPSSLYKKGGNITFDFTAQKGDKSVDTFANITINKVLIKETRNIKFESVPQWFIRLIPITLEEKRSEISDGWNTSAIIYVSPNPGEAYAKLYEQARNSIIYAIIAFAVSIVLLLIFVQFILRPLKRIEGLAKDIAKGKFDVINPLPWTTEIKNVSIAMNDMSRKIEAMINKLTNNLANLSKKLSEDELTGLSLKQTLGTDIKQMFIKKETGYIFDIRIDNLSGYVKTHTDTEIDDYIINFAEKLKNVTIEEEDVEIKAYRIFGSEFLVVAKRCNYDCARVIASKLKREFNHLSEKFELNEIAHIGGTPFNELGTLDEMRQAANEAYEKAKLIGPNEYFIRDKNDLSRDMNAWRDLITEIIDNNHFIVDFINNTYMLKDEENLIMQEAFTNAKDKENNPIPIGSFISIAEKYEKIIDFDKAVISKIIDYILINNIKHDICINLSMDSIANNTFISWLENTINTNKEISKQLVFSLSAYSVAKDMELFKNFCETVHNSNAKIIIKRFESKFIPTENLKTFNVDYIRLARDYTSDMNKDRSKIEFVESINELGNLLNIKVCAEAVKEEKDLETVKKLKLFAISR
ncbi:bifunctional diguanylate cyclase/phosphodiesterase [Halarcobacter anaerophilus]|uniref:GGDEF domain-containing protein n=1 Tax=Halarcobacter anaerophilus TaxID=877500 RepID=A0A4Q0XWY2_9BACT|nr:EAL domain-containing protein [Halarcobacter anaerophilus]QDF28244.1 diguanylate cyclase/phosphodiesterase (LapD/MoxY domain) [Halarcobacter anaerophilus]RXJ62087.1 GGDEF domain-containing protein [Halarcobacter anaerophilus]